VVWPALGHAVEILRQKISDCQQSAHSHFKNKA